MQETEATMTTSLPREQRGGGRVPQPVDVVVDGRVLLDVEVGLGHVGLGLVVVVVGDEVLDGVPGQELAELVAELRGERLVVGDHERRLLHLLDDPGHRRGLASAGRSEQGLIAVPRLQAPGSDSIARGWSPVGPYASETWNSDIAVIVARRLSRPLSTPEEGYTEPPCVLLGETPAVLVALRRSSLTSTFLGAPQRAAAAPNVARHRY